MQPLLCYSGQASFSLHVVSGGLWEGSSSRSTSHLTLERRSDARDCQCHALSWSWRCLRYSARVGRQSFIIANTSPSLLATSFSLLPLYHQPHFSLHCPHYYPHEHPTRNRHRTSRHRLRIASCLVLVRQSSNAHCTRIPTVDPRSRSKPQHGQTEPSLADVTTASLAS